MSMVTSAATPSAPSAAAVNEVAMEKKITVPPWAVASTAPPSQPGTSTQTTVTSAGPPAACDGGGQRRPDPARRRPTTSSARPGPAAPASRSAAASRSSRTTPMIRPAPARRAAATDSDPLLPAAPMTATTGDRASSPASWPPGGSAPGRRTRPCTARASGPGRSAGSTVAIDRPNKIACPSHGTCSDRPSQRASPSVMASGVSDSDTRVAIRSPGVQPERRRRARPRRPRR